MEFWFRRKYSLAPTDQRFLEATVEEMQTDFWAHHYFDNPPKDEVEDDDFDLQAELEDANRLAALEQQRNDPNDWEDV